MHDLIERQAAIDALNVGAELLRRVLDDADIVGAERAKYEWGLGLIESYISDMKELPSAQPEHTNSWYINSWCNNCKEYDTENKCCPRYNRVIKQTLDDAYRHGETEAEARYHAQQRWIPCSERLPEERQEILATTTDNAWGDVVIIRTYYKEMHKSVIAWMPLPEPYAERRTDEAR